MDKTKILWIYLNATEEEINELAKTFKTFNLPYKTLISNIQPYFISLEDLEKFYADLGKILVEIRKQN